MTTYSNTFQLENGHPGPTCDLVSSGNDRKGGNFPNEVAGAAGRESLWGEFFRVRPNSKPENNPERLGEILLRVLEIIKNRKVKQENTNNV